MWQCIAINYINEHHGTKRRDRVIISLFHIPETFPLWVCFSRLLVWGFGTVFSTVGRTAWVWGRPLARPSTCSYRTTQHRKTRTNIHASRENRTHDPSIEAIKTHSLSRAVAHIGHIRQIQDWNLGPALGCPDWGFSWFTPVYLGRCRDIILN
jgi:hypothetical protein